MVAEVKILYFASLRESLGIASEAMPLTEAATLQDLIDTLRARGGAYAEALAAHRRWRAAVNHDMAALDAALKAGDEVAIFPPVTGG